MRITNNELAAICYGRCVSALAVVTEPENALFELRPVKLPQLPTADSLFAYISRTLPLCLHISLLLYAMLEKHNRLCLTPNENNNKNALVIQTQRNKIRTHRSLFAGESACKTRYSFFARFGRITKLVTAVFTIRYANSPPKNRGYFERKNDQKSHFRSAFELTSLTKGERDTGCQVPVSRMCTKHLDCYKTSEWTAWLARSEIGDTARFGVAMGFIAMPRKQRAKEHNRSLT